MAPTTRSHAARQRAAKDPRPATGKQGGIPKPRQRSKVKCPTCGEPCAKGAGLASHVRAKHPVAPDPHSTGAGELAAVGQSEPDVHGERVVPSPPEGMGDSATTLWRSIVNVYDLRPDELRILEDACREAQLIDRLEREISTQYSPLIVKGSMGQPVANPLVSEIRQHRTALAGLFRKLELPDDNVSSDSPAERSVKARAAANARWRRGS